MRNSHGNDYRGIRRFLADNGIKPSLANVERVQREVSRSQTENERVERIAKETGRGGTRTLDGREVAPIVKRQVRRQLDQRKG